MTTRAIHLELVTDKSTDAFPMAFRRFVCTRGNPNVCWSDCGSNFVGAQRRNPTELGHPQDTEHTLRRI